MSQQLPDYCQEQIENFRKFVEMKQKEYNILDKEIINIDEVPLTFDMPMSHTVDAVGQKQYTTTGIENVNFTCVLAVTAESYKLTPMIIFKRKTVPKENFPPGIVVKVNPKRWMDRGMIHVWLNSCYRKIPGGFFG